MRMQNSILNDRLEVNWSALRARMCVMAIAEKKVYLESVIREVGRIPDQKIPAVVQELREMQSEIKS